MTRSRTPMGVVVRGVVAGVIGTVAMDVMQTAVHRVRGQKSGEYRSWEEAPAPAQIGKRVVEDVFRRGDVPAQRISTLNNAVHWTYGSAWGAFYGLLQETFRPRWSLHGV